MFEGVKKNYVIVDSKEKVNQLLEHIGDHGLDPNDVYDVIAFDTEDTGLNVRKDHVIGFSVCAEVGESFYFPMLNWDAKQEKLVEPQIAGVGAITVGKKILNILKGRKLVMHNGDYDCRIVNHDLGIDLLSALYAENILVIHTVQEEGAGRGGAEIFGLKKVAIAIQDKIGLDVEKAANEEQLELWESIKNNGGAVSKAHYEIYKAAYQVLGKYAAADTDLTLREYIYFMQKLVAENMQQFFFEDEVMPLYKEVTIPMEDHGIALDIPLLEKTKADIIKDMEAQKKVVVDTLLKEEPGQRWVIDQAIKNFPCKKTGAWATAFIERYALPIPKSEKTGKYLITKANIAALEDGWQKEFLQTGNEDLVPEKERVRISLALWKEMNDGDYFNVQSSRQLADIVFNYYKEEPPKVSEKGQEAFDGAVIEILSKKYEWVENLRIYRKLQKIKTTYIDRFLDGQEDGRYYFYYRQNGTVSGRYASDAQQLPKPMEEEQDVPIVVHYNHLVRKFLISGPGYSFVDADFESLEPHCFASVSGDEGLRDIFRNNWDFYSTIAIRTEKLDKDKKKYPDGVSADKSSPVFLKKLDPVKRQSAKGYALGVPYGMEGFALGKRLGIPRKDAQALVDGYLNGFPQLKEWYNSSREFVYKNGYIKTLVGRTRHLQETKKIYDTFGLNILNWQYRKQLVQEGICTQEEVDKIYRDFKNGRNNCLNFQLQSLGASVVGRAAIAITRKLKELGIDGWVCAQVHDQLIVCLEEGRAEEFKPWMEKLMAETTILPGVELRAPAEIGKNMYETH